MIPISYYLILSTIIFAISIAGIFINRKNNKIIENILICLSVALNSIKVPPLKSTPKFRPLKNRKNIEINTNNAEARLNVL